MALPRYYIIKPIKYYELSKFKTGVVGQLAPLKGHFRVIRGGADKHKIFDYALFYKNKHKNQQIAVVHSDAFLM